MVFLEGIFVFLLGTIVGSFLSVLVHRHGFIETRRGRSSCSSCLKELSWYELVPVLSFLFLKGRCKTCGSKLSLQDPLIEVTSGLLFLGVYLTTPLLYGLWYAPTVVGLFIFWSAFLILTAYDLKHTLVPFSFVLWLIGSAVAVRVFETLYFGIPTPLYDGVLAGAFFAGFIGLLVLVTRGRGMGVGDIYVSFALGMVFGVVRGLEVLALSFWLGAIIGIVLIILKKLSPSVQLPGMPGPLTIKSEVPFIPFLFLGSLIGAFTTFSPLLEISRLF